MKCITSNSLGVTLARELPGDALEDVVLVVGRRAPKLGELCDMEGQDDGRSCSKNAVTHSTVDDVNRRGSEHPAVIEGVDDHELGSLAISRGDIRPQT